MYVEPQEENECLLVTIGALSNISVKRLKELGRTHIHPDFDNLISGNDDCLSHWGAAVWLARLVNLPIDCILPPPISANESFKDEGLTELPDGRGAVTFRIYTKDGKFQKQHVCPFKDKLVRDPEFFFIRNDGMRLKDYIRFFSEVDLVIKPIYAYALPNSETEEDEL